MADDIERCWELIEAGKLDQASHLVGAMRDGGDVELALEIEHLRAAIAMESGRPEEARGIWERLVARFPDELEPRLELARVAALMDDAEAALAVAREAVALSRQLPWEEAELAGLLIVAWAEQELAGAAREEDLDRLGALVGKLTPADADLCYDLATVFRDAERDELALACFTRSAEVDPEHADAHYERGLLLREQGDDPAACDAFLATLRLDRSEAPPPWHLGNEEVESLVEEALGALPAHVVERLRNVPILVEDFPSEESVREGADPRLFGIFAGIPYPESGSAVPTSPDHIVVYLGSLERACLDRAELEEQLRITVWHETGHFFGLEEEDLEALGLD